MDPELQAILGPLLAPHTRTTFKTIAQCAPDDDLGLGPIVDFKEERDMNAAVGLTKLPTVTSLPSCITHSMAIKKQARREASTTPVNVGKQRRVKTPTPIALRTPEWQKKRNLNTARAKVSRHKAATKKVADDSARLQNLHRLRRINTVLTQRVTDLEARLASLEIRKIAAQN